MSVYVDFSNDPLINAWYGSIKSGITATYNARAFGSCLTLIYCGIDLMAYLGMPIPQKRVKCRDFVNWAEKYLCPQLGQGISGIDLYAARCNIVHSYSVGFRRTDGINPRKIGYLIRGDGTTSTRYSPKNDADLVWLPFDSLLEAFFEGVEEFLSNAYDDDQLEPVLIERVGELFMTDPH
ncbi:MAG: hypothetical protein FJ316_10715 [SAR202 cluster bacterium]|nr:hypothetical protein [SAR202 cluster bacterium]